MRVLPLMTCAGALALAACATTGERSDLAAACDDQPGQSFVGQRATAEAGTQLLRLTGAQLLRWGPPRSAMTMDFRQDRVTVAYDDAMIITRIACG